MATGVSATTAANPRAITALFKNKEDADLAYEWLLKNGFDSDEIHLLMSEETKKKYHYAGVDKLEMTQRDTVAGLEIGAAVGGGLGAVLGIVAAVSAAVVIPGLGLVVAGPLAAALAGAGGLVGGILGALYGSSIPMEKVQELEHDIREGGILISVVPQDAGESARIENEWFERGGEIIQP